MPIYRLNTFYSADETHVKLSIETLEELDWCLEQLETMQTHRSVSDMASSKVRACLQKILNNILKYQSQKNCVQISKSRLTGLEIRLLSGPRSGQTCFKGRPLELILINCIFLKAWLYYHHN